jgi:hypothetical protein
MLPQIGHGHSLVYSSEVQHLASAKTKVIDCTRQRKTVTCLAWCFPLQEGDVG